jgi:hypothetical protein
VYGVIFPPWSFGLLQTYPFFFAAFFLFAQAAFIAIDILDLKSASSGGAIAASIALLPFVGFAATACVFAALTLAQRARVASAIRFLPAVLMVRLLGAGALGFAQSGIESFSLTTDELAGMGPCSAAIAASIFDRSVTSRLKM